MLYINEVDRLTHENYILEKRVAELLEQNKNLRKTLDDYRKHESNLIEKYWELQDKIKDLKEKQ